VTWPFKRRATETGCDLGEPRGIFLFDDVGAAIKAEAVLRRAGYATELVYPPRHLRIGCDLAVAVAAAERLGAERALAEAGAAVRGWADP